MDHRIHDVVAWLEQDLLRHLVLLKTLAQYPHATECRFQDGPDGPAALLTLGGAVSGFDRANYPGLDLVVFVAVPHPGRIPPLLAGLPTGRNLLFKLMDASHPAAVASIFPVRRVAAYHSFAPPPERRFECPPEVTVSSRLTDELLAVYTGQRHVADEVRHHFAGGGRAFTVYANGRPASSCFIYPNYGRVWEIGALYTESGFRRRGLARMVVSAAYHALGRDGLTARYQADETNEASIRLAESIGLRRFLINTHWLHVGRSE